MTTKTVFRTNTARMVDLTKVGTVDERGRIISPSGKPVAASQVAEAIMAVMDGKMDPGRLAELEKLSNKQVSVMFRKIKKVIPEDLLDRFSALSDVMEKMQWEFGDLTNEVWKHVQASKVRDENDRPYTFLDVCFFVSIVCIRGQRTMNTVRAWALTARHYSASVRAKYAEQVPFSHFTYAAQEKFSENDQWKKILEFSKNPPDGQYYSVTESQLREHFEGKAPGKGTNYKPATKDFIPTGHTVSLADVQNAKGDTSDAYGGQVLVEFDDLVHRLQGLTSIISVKYPNITPVISQAVLLLGEALRMMTQGSDRQS